jgi:hypothetical protein
MWLAAEAFYFLGRHIKRHRCASPHHSMHRGASAAAFSDDEDAYVSDGSTTYIPDTCDLLRELQDEHHHNVSIPDSFIVVPASYPLNGSMASIAPDDREMSHLASQMAVRSLVRSRKANIVHGALASTYPHLERYYEGEDDAFAKVDWSACSGIDLWNELTSKHLACGRISSMACA